MSLYQYAPHPRTVAHTLQQPTKVRDQHKAGFNGWLARTITEGVSTMWCAYIFAALALVALPKAIEGGTLSTVQWVSQTFLQLTLLSIIMVGQQVLGAASDRRAINTYADAEAILQEAQQIQAHLAVQDAALEILATKLGIEVSALRAAAAELSPLVEEEPKTGDTEATAG